MANARPSAKRMVQSTKRRFEKLASAHQPKAQPLIQVSPKRRTRLTAPR
jgi:hypothetical protein